jgi:uncharacterized zinc-type alcohol dehydrogenase-like protein
MFFLQARFRTICENGTFTYNSPDKHLEGKQTYGGYSTSVVVDENLYYAFRKFRQATAPPICAGVTTWSPLRHWNVKKRR